MSKPIPLATLIRQMERTTQSLPNLIEKELDDVIAQILFEIGKATAYDTLTTRKLFITMLYRHFNRQDLVGRLYQDPYEHWNTIEERAKDGDNYALAKNIQHGKSKYGIMIDSEAFTTLDTTPDSVSKRHPRGNDPNLRSLMTEYVMDMYETASNAEIELAVNKLEEKILKILEGIKGGK